ncbi:MAG: hypothetical protein HQL56_01010 [Magnetococcales bacterium]|nr:hypothetical protein [Magnetococcales bacterium]
MARKTVKKEADELEPEAQGSVLDRQDEVIVQPSAVVDEEITFEELGEANGRMLGAFVVLVVEIFKEHKTAWDNMPPEKRDDLVATITKRGQEFISQAALAMAAKGRRVVTGTLNQATIKDCVRIIIDAPKSPEACSAFGMSAGGGQVAFLLLDAEGFLDPDGIQVKTAPEQLALPFDGEGDFQEDLLPVSEETPCPL